MKQALVQLQNEKQASSNQILYTCAAFVLLEPTYMTDTQWKLISTTTAT